MLLLLADKVRSLQGMTLQGRPAQPGAGSAISHLAIKPATERARLLVGNGTLYGAVYLFTQAQGRLTAEAASMCLERSIHHQSMPTHVTS